MPRSNPKNFSDPDSPFEIVEVEVFDETSTLPDDKHLNAEAEVRIPSQEKQDRQTRERDLMRRRRRHAYDEGPPRRKKKYNWAFFLCSLFLGIAITATLETPIGVLGGIGLGFLFFVDPIYDKLMDKIENW